MNYIIKNQVFLIYLRKQYMLIKKLLRNDFFLKKKNGTIKSIKYYYKNLSERKKEI